MAANYELSYTTDLSQTAKMHLLKYGVHEGESNAHSFHVKVVRDGEEVDLSDSSIIGYFRKNGKLIMLGGDVVDNRAVVTFTTACYSPGIFDLLIMATEGEVESCILWVHGVSHGTYSDIIEDDSGVTLGNLLARIVALESSTGTGTSWATVPDYWQEHIDARVDDVNTAMAAAAGNRSAFLFYTDAHWTGSYQQGPALLKYLAQNTPVKKVIFGGDIIESESDLAYVDDWREQVSQLPWHHSVAGNHDDSITDDGSSSDLWGVDEAYKFLLEPEITDDVVRGDKMYYHIDVDSEETRYIFLDTATGEGNILNDTAQQTWLQETLLSTPDGWHIVAVGHIWRIYSSGADAGWGMGAKLALDMLDAYNARTGDYSACTGKVEFCVGGHCHWDADHTSDGGIPVILTECESYYSLRSGLSATQGTITESSVSAIVADYAAGVVKVIRIGRGNSRTVNLDGSDSTEEVEPSDYDLVAPTGDFTNVLKAAINADGTSYNNGYGYLNDTRVKSDQTDTAAEGWDSTGYFAAACGDVIRFLNLEFLDLEDTGGDTKRTAFHCFDSEFNFVSVSPTFVVGTEPTAWSPVYDDNGDIVQLTIPSADYYANTAYVRIVAKNITGASVITVNEEINV